MKKKRSARSSISSLSLTGKGNPFNRKTKKRKSNSAVSSNTGAFNVYG